MPVNDILTKEEKKQLKSNNEEQETAMKMGITVERLRQIRAYAGRLHQKYPHWKPHRIKRKTAKYFKITLT